MTTNADIQILRLPQVYGNIKGLGKTNPQATFVFYMKQELLICYAYIKRLPLLITAITSNITMDSCVQLSLYAHTL